MANGYTYGPLKSDYFTQFEKMWIEGFCKERNITLSEDNICVELVHIKQLCPNGPVFGKVSALLAEADKFSSYSKGLLGKSWDNILGYAMNVVKPTGLLSEGQVDNMKMTNKWWLLEAPKIMMEEMQASYYKSFVVECVSNNGNAINDAKQFNPMVKSQITENAKKYFTYERITMKYPPCRIPFVEILKNEPVLNMVPECEKIIGMIAWTAECNMLLKNVKPV
jgi:hypothetical protein